MLILSEMCVCVCLTLSAVFTYWQWLTVYVTPFMQTCRPNVLSFTSQNWNNNKFKKVTYFDKTMKSHKFQKYNFKMWNANKQK